MDFPNIKIEIEKDILHEFPFNFEKNIKSLLKVVPPEHLTQLTKIQVVGYSSEKKQKEAYGFYYGKREGANMPTVMICVDNLFKKMPRIIFYIIPFIPKFLLADTLYHEIAHHYQRISHGIKMQTWERDAESYSRFMKRKFFKKYIWVLSILFGSFLIIKNQRTPKKNKESSIF